ncbi:MAG: hypothetical protein ACU843_18205 [Gammaproteobacteria bacterium]
MIVDDVIDHFVDTYGEESSIALLMAIAHPEQGGMGYRMVFFNPAFDIDGYEVDEANRLIRLDTKGLFSSYSVAEVADSLKQAVEVDIIKSRASWLERYGVGTGKVVLGVVETSIGLVGIIVPEPGTTAAGIAVFALGSNTLVDGFSQLAGVNRGYGYNILGEASGAVGAGISESFGGDRETGRMIGRGVFLVASVAIGTLGSIRILHVPGQTFLRTGLGGQPGGIAIGRIDMLYGSYRARDGLTILSINNNANQSILRFVVHSGRLVVNGRIVGVERVLVHESNAMEILKGLLKLLAHGAKLGW